MNYILKLKSNTKIFEFIKFAIVGIGATAIHYIIYYFLQIINLQYNIAYTIGYFISFIFNFLASNYFTFRTKPTRNKGLRFLLSHLFNYTLQLLLLNIFIYIGINKNIAPIIVFFISVPINFSFVRLALKVNQ